VVAISNIFEFFTPICLGKMVQFHACIFFNWGGEKPATSHASILASKWRTQSYFHIEMMAFFQDFMADLDCLRVLARVLEI